MAEGLVGEIMERLTWPVPCTGHGCADDLPRVHLSGGGHGRPHARPETIKPKARVRMALAEVGYTKDSYVGGTSQTPVVNPIVDGRMEIPGWTIWLAYVTSMGPGAYVACYTCWANRRVCFDPKPYVPGRFPLDDCEPPMGQGNSIDIGEALD